MQMKINLDDLFGQSKSNAILNKQYQQKLTQLKTQHELQQSFQSFSRPSQYKFALDAQAYLFGSDQQHDDSNQNTNSDFTDRNQHHSQKQYSYHSKSTNRQILPGQRLYYQHKTHQLRKLKQIQRIKMEQISKQLEQTKKKPIVNQQSLKILQKKNKEKNTQISTKNLYTTIKMNSNNGSMLRKENNNKNHKQEIKTTAMKKQQQELKKCTFKPQLIAKGSDFVKNRPKQKVFNNLFEQHKLKQYRKKMIQQQNQLQISRNTKKLSKAEFDSFIERSDKYLQKIDKKQKIINSAAKAYDLDSGIKLFSPKISNQQLGQKVLKSNFTQKKKPNSIFNKLRQQDQKKQQKMISEFKLFTQIKKEHSNKNQSTKSKETYDYEQFNTKNDLFSQKKQGTIIQNQNQQFERNKFENEFSYE